MYNPDSASMCEPGAASQSGDSSKAVDYAGKEIFTTQELALIEKHKPFYIKAAEEYSIPWEMLAVVHYRETRLSRTNHSNGQGIYQDYEKKGGPYPAGEKVSDEEFQRQTNYAAKILVEKAGKMKGELKNNSSDAVKYTFFGYNGRAKVYKTQAKNLGFTDEQAELGEGSPYVMNKADAKRDPNTNGDKWGQIKTDGGSIKYPANQDHGAFVMYASINGSISAGCFESGQLTSGGLTEKQAKQFMIHYGTNKNDSTKKAMASSSWTACGGGGKGGGSNCVSFTEFFINKFTKIKARDSKFNEGRMGDGSEVVGFLKNRGVPTGKEPKVGAVFSTTGSPGHTGIVLGIDGDNVIIGHASCNRGKDGQRGAGDGTESGNGSGFVLTGKRSSSKPWWGGSVAKEFAYPEIDTAAIERYLQTGE
ncbi:MAG TPA: hypothetical protein PKD19_00145 [Candidatus Saccharibacteria bacterium]|nr:hypothetical protein [Candidatus Saccharibacteria bacterium]HMR38178.1 hypothetical protein [Candidatus Saccharibacteria bacterium]